MKNIFDVTPEIEREYIDSALAMYDGGWRSGDAEDMRSAYKPEELSDAEIEIVCDILWRYENRIWED